MDTATDINGAIDDYISLTEAKRELAEKQRTIQKKLDELEPSIVADFQEHGRQSESRNGMVLYISRDLSIKAKEGGTEDIVAVVRKAGAEWGSILGLNWPKTKALIKERLEDKNTGAWEVNDKKLPPSIREIVELSEFFSLRCRKA